MKSELAVYKSKSFVKILTDKHEGAVLGLKNEN
jgi:hypothetical protein